MVTSMKQVLSSSLCRKENRGLKWSVVRSRWHLGVSVSPLLGPTCVATPQQYRPGIGHSEPWPDSTAERESVAGKGLSCKLTWPLLLGPRSQKPDGIRFGECLSMKCLRQLWFALELGRGASITWRTPQLSPRGSVFLDLSHFCCFEEKLSLGTPGGSRKLPAKLKAVLLLVLHTG